MVIATKSHPSEVIDYDMVDFWFKTAGYEPADEAKIVHQALIKPTYGEFGAQPTIVVLGGGEQAGKSYLGGHHMFAMHPFGKIFWIVGERYEDSKKEFEYLTNAAIKIGALHPDNVSFPLERSCRAVFNNGLVVRTLSSGDVTTLAGESPDGILMVEAGRQSYQAFRVLLGRAQHNTAWFLVSGTFESTRGRWFPDLWKQAQGDNEYLAKSYSLPSWANKSKYPLGAKDPKILAARKTMTEDEFVERFLGQPRPTIGVVFAEFRRSVHVRAYADYDPGYPVRLWVDPGFSPSSYAVMFVQLVGDQIRIFDEIYTQHLVNEEVLDLVKNHPRFEDIEAVVIDVAAETHAGSQTPAAETWRKGLAGRIPVRSRFVKEAYGRQRIHDKLRFNPIMGAPYLVFHPRCERTIWEFEEGYKFHVSSKLEVTSSAPIDKDNHSIKAIAYGIVDTYGLSDIAERISMPKAIRRRMSYDS